MPEDNQDTPRKWHLIGGRLPRAKLAPIRRRRAERTDGEEPQDGGENIREENVVPEPSFVRPSQSILPSDFAHLEHKTFKQQQEVWAISCEYSSKGVRYGVEDLPYIVAEGPLKWSGNYKPKWDSYKVVCSGLNRTFYECNLFTSREDARKDAEIRNNAIKQ